MLCVTAAACAAPFFPSHVGAKKGENLPIYQWRGIALGVPGQITIGHPDPHRARTVARYCVGEVRRLERIFSLYDPDSELSRLNRTGRLDQASLDFRHLLRESQILSQITDGAFDVTVQPLWQLYSKHFRLSHADLAGPSQKNIAATRRLIDYTRLDISAASVGFLAPGMSATLNGIAQGYIDDRISDLLSNEGFDQVLIDLGEIRSMVANGERAGWTVGIGYPGGDGRPLAEVILTDGALATSSGYSASFDSAGRHHHLFDPVSGTSATKHRQVSVLSPRATLSDALATALSVLPAESATRLLKEAGADRALIVPHNGPPVWYSSA
jgi:thiamine biosynthesis lipoprotein